MGCAALASAVLIAPNVLSYVNGGYSGSDWSGTTLVSNLAELWRRSTPTRFNRNGWFVGGGVENNLSLFGISAPGWFMKTEYRAAYYDRKAITERIDVGTNALVGRDITFKPLGPDHQHFAGLPLQLERRSGQARY